MKRREASQKLSDAMRAGHDHITDDTEYGQVIEVLQAATPNGSVTVERRTLIPLVDDWAEGFVHYKKA